MKKKSILVAAIAVMLVAALVVGGTLAYFTDKSEVQDNVFTVGNVKIGIREVFDKDSAVLIPGKDINKDVFVKNTGAQDAYVRVHIAIPSALDDGYETFNAGKNVLHYNFGNKVVDGVVSSTEGAEWIWTHGSKWNYFETTMHGIKYNVYYADYHTAVAAGKTTEQFVQGVYLDKSFEMKEDGAYAFGEKLTLDEGWDWSKVTCPVFSIACQAEGFDTPAAAFDAAFGANYNPWGTEATNWQ